MSLSDCLYRSLVKGLFVLLLSATGFLYMALDTPTPAERPVAEGSPEWFIQTYDCYEGDTPKGVEPGHVVIRPEGTNDYFLGGTKWVNEAIEQVFGGSTDHTIVAFCP